MSSGSLPLAPAVAFAVSLAALAGMLRSRWVSRVLDRPNARSLHTTPVPRVGGLGLFAGTLLAWAIGQVGLPGPLWTALAALLVVSLVDDRYGVPVVLRFAVHLGAAALFVVLVLGDALGPAGATGAVLSIAWMTNLYNFMDGSDGLAGGMAAIGFACYGAAALAGSEPALAAAAFSVAAAALAFLVFNFHPARIFMGDAGSIPLGFLAAALGLLGWRDGLWPAWFPVVVFSPFIVDASVTLARRALRGERIWRAHRSHYYQRMVLAGWGHRRTAIVEYCAMLACSAAALAGLSLEPGHRNVLLAAVGCAYVALIVLLERVTPRPEPAR